MKEHKENITVEMETLLRELADLAECVSNEVYDDDNKNGTMGILNLCDELSDRINQYLENR